LRFSIPRGNRNTRRGCSQTQCCCGPEIACRPASAGRIARYSLSDGAERPAQMLVKQRRALLVRSQPLSEFLSTYPSSSSPLFSRDPRLVGPKIRWDLARKMIDWDCSASRDVAELSDFLRDCAAVYGKIQNHSADRSCTAARLFRLGTKTQRKTLWAQASRAAQLDRCIPKCTMRTTYFFQRAAGASTFDTITISRCATITRSTTGSRKAPGPDLDTTDDLPNRIRKGHPMTDIAAFPHAGIHDLGFGVAHLRYLP
jgi:hypothetical protein